MRTRATIARALRDLTSHGYAIGEEKAHPDTHLRQERAEGERLKTVSSMIDQHRAQVASLLLRLTR